MKTSLLFAAVLSSLAALASASWGFGSTHSKVLLRDVQVLTLHHGKMTTGRRSSPVPQLKCVGGSAMGKFTPKVVQCYNRGWDGQDVQWECKTDMDNMFRFGNVEVVCEGYDYPDDPYILQGSCGLEYTLDYTMEGQERAKREEHDYYYGSSKSYSGYGGSYYANTKSTSGIRDWILLFVAGLVIYALYKTCIGSEQSYGDRQYSSTDGDYPGGNPGGGGWFSGGGNGGGGYGSRGSSGYHYRGNTYDDASCNDRGRNRGGGGGGGGGFWTGLATGGLAGYMFGNRGGGYGYGGYGGYNRGYYGGAPAYGGGGWGGGSRSAFGGFGGSSGASSSGTRTASGFGGTRRR